MISLPGKFYKGKIYESQEEKRLLQKYEKKYISGIRE